MAPRQPKAQALAVHSGRIIAVGSESQVFLSKGPATQMIDLQGHTLLPGFVEPHTHVLNTAIFNFVWINVSSFDTQHPNSVAQVQAALSAHLPQPEDCGTEPLKPGV